jgi:beta-glucosidase/6-phospho-beta-glucosidase/beta-galactosidase
MSKDRPDHTPRAHRAIELDPSMLAELAASDLTRLASVRVGVATSSFQTEGSLDLPGFPQTNWADWQRVGKVERIGDGCSLWARFDRVVDRLRSLRATVFRLSFEWARLCPDGPSIDARAARGYAQRLASLRRAGIEPIVTLQHFTHPAWLGPDLWLDRRSPELFAEYSRAAIDAVQSALVALGEKPITHWITINECNMLALATYGAGVFPHRALSLAEGSPAGAARALLALDHLASAHVLAYDAIHALHDRRGWPSPDVTHNPNLVDLYTLCAQWLDAMRTNARTARERHAFIARRRALFERSMLESNEIHSARADVARAMDRAIAAPLALDAFDRLSTLLSARGARPAIDSRAFDLYDPWTRNQVRGAEHALDAVARGDLAPALSLLGATSLALAEPWEWQCDPSMLQRALRAMHDPDDPVPLDVMENGMAVERQPSHGACPRLDGARRPDFVRGYALAFAHARCVLALPARTYAHWTLVDNYELGRWAPRFGLYALEDPRDGRPAEWSLTDAQGDSPADELRAFSLACGDLDRARAWVDRPR